MPLRKTARRYLKRLVTTATEAFNNNNTAPSSPPRPPPPIDQNGLRDDDLEPYDPLEGDGYWVKDFWARDWREVEAKLHASSSYVRFKKAGFQMAGYRVRLAVGAARIGAPGTVFPQYVPSLMMLATKTEADDTMTKGGGDPSSSSRRASRRASSRLSMVGLLPAGLLPAADDAWEPRWRASFARMREYLNEAGGQNMGLQMMDEGVFHGKNKSAARVGRLRSSQLIDLEDWADIIRSQEHA
ncbi:hypothetical protein SLS62_001900 [Diatrype stigma]|uniref:Uncharacterized protein n=1 Tax=Diatrype stigma TaxID=117547 RepID=A0AAN9YR76_9PEZI